MSHEIAGYVIAAIAVLAAIGGVAMKVYDFRERWDVATIGGNLVRFEGVEPDPKMLASIAVANKVVAETLRVWYPKNTKLTAFRVIVRPVGRVGITSDGKPQAGTPRTERMLPITPIVDVAIVHTENVAAYIAHEVSRHCTPRRLKDNGDPDHRLAEFAKLEVEMKDRVKTGLIEKGLA